MTHFTRTLVGAGIGLVLLALPLAAGADNSSHRIGFTEDDTGGAYDVATYGMVELTTIEEIANGDVLDLETIRFLEDNIWDYEGLAKFAGIADGIDPVLGDELPTTDEQTGQVYDERVPWLGGTLSY